MCLFRGVLLFCIAWFCGLACAAEFSPIPSVSRMTDSAKAAVPFDLSTLKRNWKQRIDAMRAAGVMPMIDVESTLDEQLDLFRHYPSPDQIQRGNLGRDEDLPIDGPAGQLLFEFAAQSGIPFQIHQEIEDQYLPPLQKMLSSFPKAKVVWCHLAQMRYQGRNTLYGPDYVRKLIEQHPNLYFDLFVGPPEHVYPASKEYPGKYWDRTTGRLKPEWVKLIADHPWRFMTALDLNPFIMQSFARKVAMQRAVLDSLPEPVREIVAYRAAWKLIFNEEL
jgi:hypothetical protein